MRAFAPYILTFVSVGAPFLFWVGFQMSGYTNQKFGIFLMILSGVLWLIAIGVSIFIYWKNIKKFIGIGLELVFVSYFFWSTILVVIIAGGLAGWGWWRIGKAYQKDQAQLTQKGTSERPGPSPPVVATPSSGPKTIHELFQEDFPASMKHILEKEFVDGKRDNIKTKFIFCLHENFEAKSKFVSFYIPFSPSTFDACCLLAGAAQSFLDEAAKVQIRSLSPGDSSSEWSKDLVFTGKFYAYHESELTHEQIGQLESLYRSKGFSIQFRGQSYATTRFLQSRAK